MSQSKFKRPSFLPLEKSNLWSSYGQSEYYVLPKLNNYNDNNSSSYFSNKNYNNNNNVYSPSNSVESGYSSQLSTPTTQFGSNFTTTPTTPDSDYSPYLSSHFDNDNQKDNFAREQQQILAEADFNKSIDNKNHLHQFNQRSDDGFAFDDQLSISHSTEFNEQIPDWYDESVNLNQSFKYYESNDDDLYDDDDDDDDDDELVDSSDLDKTLTNFNGLSINQLENDGYCDDKSCPIAFKQLLDRANSIYLRIFEREKLTKVKTYSLDNPPPFHTKFCKFCKNNREPRHIYMTHATMNENGKVTCPILQQYRCELCGSTGEDAHTRSYCPYGRMIRETMPDINDTFEFYNKKSMIHSTDSHLYDNELNDDELSD